MRIPMTARTALCRAWLEDRTGMARRTSFGLMRATQREVGLAVAERRAQLIEVRGGRVAGRTVLAEGALVDIRMA